MANQPAASKLAARPSTIKIEAPVIGKLPDGVSVELSRCAREARWCRIRSEQYPSGWVRGAYLVGAAAKARATPPEFVNPPDWPF